MSEQDPQFAFHPQVLPRGDGTFLVKPGRPVPGRQKVSIAEAVRRYGASHSTWARLFDAGLVSGERPSPKKILLFVDSIEAHLKSSQDPEYWTREYRQRFKVAIG